MADEEDPYAVSSDSEDERPKGPPPKIQIEGRQAADMNKLKSALTETKEVAKDESKKEDLELIKQQADERKKFKEEFEAGKVSKTSEAVEAAKAAMAEEQLKIKEAAKENLSKFKDKFENIESTLGENLEERLKTMEKEMLGLGKETLSAAKQRFEKGEESGEPVEREKIEIVRSDADKKRVFEAFKKDMTADEAPKECAVCGKTVYQAERIFANKHLYHNTCFKCAKCAKKLLVTNYNSHEGVLLCKVHMLEVFHPELAKTMNPDTTEEDERVEEDEDEFAVSSKPRQLGKDVVRSGAGGVDEELAALKNLKGKRGDWESNAQESKTIEKTEIDMEALKAAGVKDKLDKFTSGAALEHEDAEVKEKEELKFEQVSDIKNKWKTGQMETAEQNEAAERKALDELKGGASLKDRFTERTEPAADAPIEKHWDASQIDTSFANEARKAFNEGSAFAGGAVEKTAADLADLKFTGLSSFKDKFEKCEGDVEVQKTAVDIKGADLGNLKTAFEGGKSEEDMSPEERAAAKKAEIEAEFNRYKLARKAAAQRTAAQAEANEQVKVEAGEGGADVSGIKNRFDAGDAFKSEGGEKGELDSTDFKIAGKAREKFRQIDAAGPAMPIAPGQKKAEPSKWDKKDDKPVAEVVNKRVVQDDEPDEDEAFDVKTMMNRFKNIAADGGNKPVVAGEQRAELEGIKSGASNFKQRFETVGGEDDAAAEERRKEREQEMELLKKEREAAQKALEEERAAAAAEAESDEKEDVGVKADHASKMAAKWEKIHQKEAKKAEKGKMPDKKAARGFTIRPSPSCAVCTTTVYAAEGFGCFALTYHKTCFRCNVCSQALRVERAQRCKAGRLFCQTHMKAYETGRLEAEARLAEGKGGVEEAEEVESVDRQYA